MESLELLQAVLPGTAALVQGTAGHLVRPPPPDPLTLSSQPITRASTSSTLRSASVARSPSTRPSSGTPSRSRPSPAIEQPTGSAAVPPLRVLTPRQIAAVSGARVGVWEAGPAESWRLHSSFLVNHRVTSIDFAQGTSPPLARSCAYLESQEPLLLEGTLCPSGPSTTRTERPSGVRSHSRRTHWTLELRQKLTGHRRATAVLEVKLSPFADILASVSVVGCSPTRSAWLTFY